MPTLYVRSPTGRVQDEVVVWAEQHDPRPKVVKVGRNQIHVVLGARPEPLPWDCLPIETGGDQPKLALPGVTKSKAYTLEELTRLSYAYDAIAEHQWRRREQIYLEERARDGGRFAKTTPTRSPSRRPAHARPAPRTRW